MPAGIRRTHDRCDQTKLREGRMDFKMGGRAGLLVTA